MVERHADQSLSLPWRARARAQEMTEPDLNNLRRILDEYERFADTISPAAPKALVAAEIHAVIAEARDGLHPSSDSTANFIDVRRIVERLEALREKADKPS